MLRIRKRGQSLLEYTVIMIVIMAVLLSMSIYFKRGVQGKWKESVDSLGEQYDPLTANGTMTHYLTQSTYTLVYVEDNIDNVVTMRKDETNSVQRKQGSRRLGSYW